MGYLRFSPLAAGPRTFSLFTIRLSISQTSTGNAFPFYMQETLGGIDGQPTLHGFADYRFRAPDLLLFQVEYDHRFLESRRRSSVLRYGLGGESGF
jgi:hypothetical protein